MFYVGSADGQPQHTQLYITHSHRYKIFFISSLLNAKSIAKVNVFGFGTIKLSKTLLCVCCVWISATLSSFGGHGVTEKWIKDPRVRYRRMSPCDGRRGVRWISPRPQAAAERPPGGAVWYARAMWTTAREHSLCQGDSSFNTFTITGLSLIVGINSRIILL